MAKQIHIIPTNEGTRIVEYDMVQVVEKIKKDICKVCKGKKRVRTDGSAPRGSGRTRCEEC